MKPTLYLFVFLAAVSAARPADKRPSEADDEIREVVIRAMFKEASQTKDGTKVYFISAETWRTDPSDEFMSRFAGNKPPVRKVSASAEDHGRVYAKQTGERGIIFSVEKIHLKSGTEAQVVGSVYRAGLNGYSDTFTLTKKAERWNITDKKVRTISWLLNHWVQGTSVFAICFCRVTIRLPDPEC